METDLIVSGNCGNVSKEDRKSTDVIVQMSRSSVIFNIVDLIREGAITLNDLAGFSEKLQAQVQFFI